jgi:HEAT repeat protein
MIRFSCPKCGKQLKAPEEYVGKQIKCTRCALSMPAPSEPASSPSEAAQSVNGNPAVATPPAPAASNPHPPNSGVFSSLAHAASRRPLLTGGIGGGLLAAALVGLVLFFLLPRDVNQSLTDLKSSDPAVSKPALEWLAEATPKDSQRTKVTGALEPLLFDGDVHKNLDPDLLLRVYLLWADKDNVPAMTRMVQTPTMPAWSTKKTGLVMEALGKMHDERAADALAEKLSDPKLNKQAVNALSVLGAKAEPAVLEYLFDPDLDTRQRASQLLTAYGTKYRTIVDQAVSRLQSTATKASAVLWFVDNAPSDEAEKAEAAPLLAKLLEDLSPEVCRDALQALKQWATPACLPSLQAYAQREQKNASGNPQLIDVLAQFKDERAADAIALQLPNDHARANAVKALSNLGPVASKAVLRYINHPTAAVQKEARDLCRKLDVSAERQLEQTLADAADPRIQRSRAALQHLAALRPDESNRAKVSQALNAALLDHDPGIRAEALNAVKVWGTQANTAALMKLLGDFQAEDVEQDGRAIAILGALKDPKAAPALAQGLTHAPERDAVSKALRAIGSGAEDAVVPFLTVADRAARFEACRILGEIGTSKSLGALAQARDNIGGMDGPFYNEALLAMQKIMARK